MTTIASNGREGPARAPRPAGPRRSLYGKRFTKNRITNQEHVDHERFDEDEPQNQITGISPAALGFRAMPSTAAAKPLPCPRAPNAAAIASAKPR